MARDNQEPAFDFASIFHPSDFSEGNRGAFLHALRIALAAKAELRMLHANTEGKGVHRGEFPAIRPIFVQWGVISDGSNREELVDTGLKIKKVEKNVPDPVDSILRYMAEHEPDLAVLSTHQRTGISRWMNQAIAEPVARESRVMTLFVPRRIVGFVSPDTGAIRLKNILIPVDRIPWPQRALDAAAALAGILGCQDVRFTLLHVGDASEMPQINAPQANSWTTERTTAKGDVVDAILEASEECDADLVVMATSGRRGFLDALRGTTTERVLRGVKCPVLAVPLRSVQDS
jgi:nucleotide-binding universal stress UspA family protein